MQNNDKSAQPQSFGIAPPQISLPKGGGAIRGLGEKFTANPVTGTGSFSIPIATSIGRSGSAPQLALTYDSGLGNGPFGLGWNLGLPAITRKTDKGLPKYRDDAESDVFILSGTEDLVPALVEVNGQWVRDARERTLRGDVYRVQRYRPRIEGLWSLIERWTHRDSNVSHWRTISPENVTTLYGATDNARIADPADPTHIFSWLISESHDDKGNVVLYEYKAEDSSGVDPSQAHERNRTAASRSVNRYPKRIRYGNRTSRLLEPDVAQTDFMFEVVFDYGEHDATEPRPDDPGEWLCRHDPFSNYRAGFEVRSYRLCQRVLMFHHFPGESGVGQNCLVRSTDFTYRSIRDNPADLRHGHPVASFIASVVQCGYRRDVAGGYVRRTLPPIELDYSRPGVREEIHEVDADSLDNLPYGMDGSRYQWVDLDGEGLNGLLTEQGGAWFYKPNLTTGTAVRFGATTRIATQPNLRLATANAEFTDLDGDGQLDLVSFAAPGGGFYERTSRRDWAPFRNFQQQATFDTRDPNLRFIDLDGDGRADVLITEQSVLTWYHSEGEAGFGAAQQVRKPFEEEHGPALVFADGTQSIYLADMCGDGLTDLVRVRNGEVCYWPNLGFGQFGAKVTLDNAPWFDAPDQFDQRRVRLADIDGSGNIDIIYVGRDGVRLYFNQSGNSLSDPHLLRNFPAIDNLAAITVVDLLGNGTACLVWSSASSASTGRQMRYIDVMGGQKPHLLISMRNNLGAETRIRYAPSTRFYLADQLAGTPWITRLPFVVHVVEQVETYDFISRNRFVSRYTYRHGFYDGVEGEFRGFGCVDQVDTEEFAALNASSAFPGASNLDSASHVPPVLTRTWFHTGAYLEQEGISRQFTQEYHREPGLTAGEVEALLLPDSILPAGLSADEERQACRALKGAMLRQEIYALDGSDAADRPYSVTESNYTIRRLQPNGENPNAVFLVHSRESLQFQYERAVAEVDGVERADPRVSHSVTLSVDDFGNVLQSVALAYGRRHDDPDSLLTQADRDSQRRMQVTFTENSYTNAVSIESPDPRQDSHRLPLLAETRGFELIRISSSGSNAERLTLEEIQAAVNAASDGSHDLAYEDIDAGGAIENAPYRRLIEHERTFYGANDLGGALALGQLESLALVFESYRLAFTPALLSHVYGARVDDSMMTEGGYVHLAGDSNWWLPSGQTFYSPNVTDTPADELTFANQHFFLTHRYRDPFGNSIAVAHDAHDLFLISMTNPLGNRVQVRNDYRVLQPDLVTDANGNRAQAMFDALGMVVGSALMGKEQGPAEGDSLLGFVADLDEATVLAHIEDPFADPHAILQRASTRFAYDLFAYQRTHDDPQPQPAVAYSLVRETHDADLAPGEQSAVQHSFAYSDGFGLLIQKKSQVEPGPVAEDPAEPIQLRWVGSGWTIFNNKGAPVRNYEPFYSATHAYEPARAVGVSSIIFYDPVGRPVATLRPNHSWEKTVFDPWQQQSWDVNDTVLIDSPSDDPDVGDFFRRLEESEYLPSWHVARASGALGPQEQQAAEKTAIHAGTPDVAHFDNLGRAFLTREHNRFAGADEAVEEFYATRVNLDIEGNERQVVDARDRVVMRYDYDLLGARIHSVSMDAGERRTLSDVAGNPVRTWDSRGHIHRFEYDSLRRALRTFVQGADPEDPDREILFAQVEYGEGLADAAERNLIGQVFRQFDGAGIATNERFDFKGNLLRSSRQLAIDYRAPLDWLTNPALEEEVFSTSTAYDALDRPSTLTAPDNSVIRPTYNEANLLERLDVNLRGTTGSTTFIANIDYNAKGQRQVVEHGNGVECSYEYDPLTFRLTRLLTRRGAERLQDLRYIYDPIGNISEMRDDAQQQIYFNNSVVEPHADYFYDAIYRLIQASGREHIGQVAEPQTRWDDAFRANHAHPHDGQAMRRYTERYEFDSVGNFRNLIHEAQHGTWTRSYRYDEPNNRLSSTAVGNTNEPYSHDAHGNMTAMPHLALMRWDHQDRLVTTARQDVNSGTPESTFHVYDASGQRVRKITDRQAAAGQTPTRRYERIYLGAFELHREYGADGADVTLERQTLHIMDDEQRVALVETRTQGDDGSAAVLIRYQFGNHLGSAALELDDAGSIISYEEYYPFGSTSFQAARNAVEVSRKRYRYTGLERDEESGLCDHGARYYAPWLGRWTAADPEGIADGVALYTYVHNQPISLTDSSGTRAEGPIDCSEPTTFTDSPDSVEWVPPEQAEREAEERRKNAGICAVQDPTDPYSMISPEEAEQKQIQLNRAANERRNQEIKDKILADARALDQQRPFFTNAAGVAVGVLEFALGFFTAGAVVADPGDNAEALEVRETAGYALVQFFSVAIPVVAKARAPKSPTVATPSPGKKTKWMDKGAEQDPKFRDLSLKDKLLSELGKIALPDKIYEKFKHIADPVARGRKIWESYRWVGKVPGARFVALLFYSPLKALTGPLWRTGASPGARGFFATVELQLRTNFFFPVLRSKHGRPDKKTRSRSKHP